MIAPVLFVLAMHITFVLTVTFAFNVINVMPIELAGLVMAAILVLVTSADLAVYFTRSNAPFFLSTSRQYMVIVSTMGLIAAQFLLIAALLSAEAHLLESFGLL